MGVAEDIYCQYTVYSSGQVLTSDRALKTNITAIPNCLDKVVNLNGVYFNWIDPSKSQNKNIGFIAQDVEEVVPELVSATSDGMKGVNYAQSTALLVGAIKEQNVIINELRNRIEALESSN